MTAESPRNVRRSWPDRLAGRVPFDPSAAEAAIRRAYGASRLPAPRHILWASGPQEAAQTVAFLANPPRRLRRSELAVGLLGAILWILVVVTIDQNTLALRSPLGAALGSGFLASITMVFGSLRTFPMPAGRTADRHGLRIVLLGLGFFLALWAYAFGLLRFGGLNSDPLLERVDLMLAALLGASPGLFLHLRMRQVYAGLPKFLYELRPPSPVARRLERARGEAWTPFRQVPSTRPDPALIEAHRQAHWQGALAQAHLMAPDRVGGLPAVSQSGFGWAPPQVPSGVPVSELPPHLDGIELVSRAARIERSGTGGPAAAFVDLAFHVDRLYPFATVALAVRPPTTIALDAEGRPHGENGPALAWADGTLVFAWHGQLVPPAVIEDCVPRSRAQIERERNPLRRLILIERYGLGRYLREAGAAEIHSDDCGRLYRLRQRWGEPIVAVRVVNHTPEPDGSFCEFWLRVPPTVVTAHEAVAWTFALPPADYEPSAQS